MRVQSVKGDLAILRVRKDLRVQRVKGDVAILRVRNVIFLRERGTWLY